MNGRDFILKLINKFRELSCLWEASNPDYHDRVVRNAALDELVKIFRPYDPAANRATVTRKINSLRSSFRKESNKVKTAQRNGYVHSPKLWYYDLLIFLENQERRKCDPSDSGLDDIQCDYDDYDEDIKEDFDPLEDDSSTTSSQSIMKRPYPREEIALKKIPKRTDQTIFQPTNQPIFHPTDQPIAHSENQTIFYSTDQAIIKDGRNNDYESFGRHVAEQLRSIPKDMVPFCQKLIGDVLLHGSLSNLNITSCVKTNGNQDHE